MVTPPVLYLELKLIYNLTILCLNGALPCVDFMNIIIAHIPLPFYKIPNIYGLSNIYL